MTQPLDPDLSAEFTVPHIGRPSGDEWIAKYERELARPRQVGRYEPLEYVAHEQLLEGGGHRASSSYAALEAWGIEDLGWLAKHRELVIVVKR